MIYSKPRCLFSFVALIMLWSCKPPASVEKIPGIILENMDTSISPKDDFTIM